MPSAAVPWSVGMVPIRGCIFVGSAWLWGSNEDLPLSDLARSQLLVSDCESVSLCEPSLAGVLVFRPVCSSRRQTIRNSYFRDILPVMHAVAGLARS